MMTAAALIVTTLFILWVTVIGPPLLPGPGEASVVVGNAIHVNRVAAYMLPWAVGLWLGGLAGMWVLRVRNALSFRAVAAMGLGTVAFIAGIRVQFRLETMGTLDALDMSANDIATSGARIPLGILAGALVAIGTAGAMRAGWRQVGDAWAVAMSTAIPVGRVGCLLEGCCFGTVCVHWPSALCLVYPRGSLAFRDQVAKTVIDPTSATSLPTHPLPIYFALASLVTLVVLLVLLKRGAEPGMLLATFSVLRPAAKLSLELLRGEPRSGVLMTAIPAVVLLATLVALGVRAMRRAQPRPASLSP